MWLALLATLPLLQDSTSTEDLVALRAAWLGPADDACLARGADVAGAVDFAWDHGLNALFPVVWRPGGPMWPSLVTKNAGGVETDPKCVDPKFRSRNVLTEIVIEGHRAGLEIVAVVDLAMAAKSEPEKPLNPLDPAVQAFTRDVVDELVGMHEVDGLAFDAHGLARWAKLDEKGVAAVGDFVAELRKIVDVRDPNVKFALVDGGAAQSVWMERGLFDLAVPRIEAHTAATWKKLVDASKTQPWCSAAPSKLAPLLELSHGTWRAETEFVLAALAHDRSIRAGGEVCSSLLELKRDDGALAFELAREPYYGLAQVPWRNGVEWRAHGDVILPKAGEGQWEWIEDASGMRILRITGDQVADASWTLTVVGKGDYDLFTWIPPLEDLTKKLAYSVAAKGGLRGLSIDPTHPNYTGWVHVGTTTMRARETREVLKLTVGGGESSTHAVAGPLVAIQARRPRSR